MYKNLKTLLLSATVATASFTATPSYANEPFLGQLMTFAGNFCPRGWEKTEGQLLQIAQNSALFSLLGTLYGGDGRITFALPDLRGRTVITPGQGPGLSSFSIGQRVGNEQQQILVQNMPAHRHQINATNTLADKGGPGDKYFAASSDQKNTPPFIYSTTEPNRTMASETVSFEGGSQPINIRAPALVIQTCIAVVGIFPSRS